MARKTDSSWLQGVTYFASGSNHAGEIQALDSVDHSIGVTAPKLNEAAIQAVEASTDVPVFLDSGAFGEVEFPAGVPTVVKPISAGTGPMYELCQRWGMPAVGAGVGWSGSRGHSPNENVRLDDLRQGIKHIAMVLDEYRE